MFCLDIYIMQAGLYNHILLRVFRAKSIFYLCACTASNMWARCAKGCHTNETFTA